MVVCRPPPPGGLRRKSGHVRPTSVNIGRCRTELGADRENNGRCRPEDGRSQAKFGQHPATFGRCRPTSVEVGQPIEDPDPTLATDCGPMFANTRPESCNVWRIRRTRARCCPLRVQIRTSLRRSENLRGPRPGTLNDHRSIRIGCPAVYDVDTMGIVRSRPEVRPAGERRSSRSRCESAHVVGAAIGSITVDDPQNRHPAQRSPRATLPMSARAPLPRRLNVRVRLSLYICSLCRDGVNSVPSSWAWRNHTMIGCPCIDRRFSAGQSSDLGRIGPKFARFQGKCLAEHRGPKWVQGAPSLVEGPICRPNVAESERKLAEGRVGGNQAKFGQIEPNLAEFGPNSAHFDQI